MIVKYKCGLHSIPVLPTVYGEELSYYESICKLTNKINEVIDTVNEFEKDETCPLIVVKDEGDTTNLDLTSESESGMYTIDLKNTNGGVVTITDNTGKTHTAAYNDNIIGNWQLVFWKNNSTKFNITIFSEDGNVYNTEQQWVTIAGWGDNLPLTKRTGDWSSLENEIESIRTDAQTASSGAGEAKLTALEAKTTANSADTKAELAISTATEALTTATEANTKATDAVSTADTANTTATQANTRAMDASARPP